MSNVAMTKVSMEQYLLDTPYEVLFEIFRSLPKGKLTEISRLRSKFRDVTKDTRLWKDVHIRYIPKFGPMSFAFEELYSGPCPVTTIDLSAIKIKPPVPPQTDQIIKVRNLNLSAVTADKVTIEAILAKYQCTALYLINNQVDLQSRNYMGIAPEAFSKQTALEVLSLGGDKSIIVEGETVLVPECHEWLTPILRNCKNLKILDLNKTGLKHLDMLGFVESLPTSLEKLLLANTFPKESFFKLLSKSAPNLRELELSPSTFIKCPSLLKFEYLETFHFVFCDHIKIWDLYKYLIKFPALKIAYIQYNRIDVDSKETNVRKLRAKLKPYDIDVELLRYHQVTPYPWTYPKDCNLWKVSKFV